MSDFWINFLANLAADALLAFAVYWIVQRPDEARKRQAIRNQALGLLKRETEVNLERAQRYVQFLDHSANALSGEFPLRYTRGAWNALKESGFLSNLDDPHLAYSLFRMNETALVANRNLRRLQLAFLEETGGDRELLARVARNDSARLLELLYRVLEHLQDIESPDLEMGAFEEQDAAQPAD